MLNHLKRFRKRVFIFSIPLITTIFGISSDITIHSILEKSQTRTNNLTIKSILEVEDNHHKNNEFNIADVLQRGGESPSSPNDNIDLISYTNLPPHKGEKILYMTFDDGPMRGTNNVLSILQEEKVDATMFLIASNVVRHLSLFKRELLMPNIMVANHTYSHASGHYSKFYSNKRGVLSDVEHAQMIIGGNQYLRLAGRNVWRLPFKERDDHGIKNRQRKVEKRAYNGLKKDGFFVYGWDVEWHFDRHGKMVDTAQKMADKIEAVLRRGRTIQKGKVVLLAHDFMFRDGHSKKELKQFVFIMRSRGWKFQTIDKYLDDTRPTKMRVARYYKTKKLTKREAICISTRKEIEDKIARAKLQGYDIMSIKKILASAPLINNDPFAIKDTQFLIDEAKHSTRISIKNNQNSDKANKSDSDFLVDAILGQNDESISKFINKVTPNSLDTQGRLALNCAVKMNDIKTLVLLINRGWNLKAKDSNNMTPLLTAKKYKRDNLEKYIATMISNRNILLAKLD